jgi:type IV secretion system protein VirB3
MLKELDRLEVDPLAVAMTRPPLFMGINFRLFFANVTISLLVCIMSHTFWGLPLFAVIYLLSYQQSLKDPNFFQLRFQWLVQTPWTQNFLFWGKTNSYDCW